MKRFYQIWFISLLIKFIISALMPLSADEAYYWVWSHNLQLSYFDHPPLVSWVFYLGHFLENFLNAVRWPAILLGHCTLLLWYEILKPHVSIEKVEIWIYLALFSPLLGLGSLIVTPDLPVVFFWSLAIYFFNRALQSRSLSTYAGLGLALGLGFCAKYHIVLFVPCLLLYLTVEKKWRSVRIAGVIATVITGLLFSLPVIIWNWQNDFVSFTFQLKHGLEKSSYDPSWTFSYLIGQFLILSPLVVWAALKGRVTHSLRWLIYFGWTPLAFFFLTSFRASVEANWPIIAYPSVYALALFHPSSRKYLKYYIGFWGALTALVLSSIFIPSVRQLNEKIAEPYIFRELAQELQDVENLYGDSYQMTSSLWYFRKKPVYKLKDISRYDFFDTLKEAVPEGNSFYLLTRKGNRLPSWVSEQEWTLKESRGMKDNYVLLHYTRP